MKTTPRPRAKVDQSTGLKPEYRFDYAKAKPNRFSSSMNEGALAILLDPDVARVFQSAESVNNVLRALLATMPTLETGIAPVMEAPLETRPSK